MKNLEKIENNIPPQDREDKDKISEIISDVSIRPYTGRDNKQYWKWSLRIKDKIYSNSCQTREEAEKMIKKYQREIAEGIKYFEILIQDLENDNETEEIDPENISDEEIQNPTRELIKGLIKWGQHHGRQFIDKTHYRISFDLHPEI